MNTLNLTICKKALMTIMFNLREWWFIPTDPMCRVITLLLLCFNFLVQLHVFVVYKPETRSPKKRSKSGPPPRWWTHLECMDPSKLWDKLHKLDWTSKKYQSYHISSYLQHVVPSKATLSYITSPWETWSLRSCEESKARKQTRKSTGFKSWGNWRISNLMIVNYYFRMFYTYIISNYIKYISICISYRIYTYIYIYHILSVSICIYYILYSSLQPDPSLIPLPTAGRFFFSHWWLVGSSYLGSVGFFVVKIFVI